VRGVGIKEEVRKREIDRKNVKKQGRKNNLKRRINKRGKRDK
jgi:hypothetical protein